MSDVVLSVAGVSKLFRRFEEKPFLVRNMLLRLVGRAKKPGNFWAVRDVGFELARGETIGLVGPNGSGKTTLLRMIAGACIPTEGTIVARGRIAPLLSLGLGFQPDMTGAECVEINATALGLSRAEIKAGREAIVEFAELREFIDTPLRFYSSGMVARLGFAVAVHATPEILLLDEVLAVGDHAFQKKCVARIREMQRQGVAILMVSHGGDAIRELCGRVLLMREGRILRDGAPGPIMDEYEEKPEEKGGARIMASLP